MSANEDSQSGYAAALAIALVACVAAFLIMVGEDHDLERRRTEGVDYSISKAVGANIPSWLIEHPSEASVCYEDPRSKDTIVPFYCDRDGDGKPELLRTQIRPDWVIGVTEIVESQTAAQQQNLADNDSEKGYKTRYLDRLDPDSVEIRKEYDEIRSAYDQQEATKEKISNR